MAATVTGQALRVLVVARSPLTRMGIVSLLRRWPAIHVVGDLPDSASADQLTALTPDLVLWSLEWEPGAEQLAALSSSPAPVVALAADDQLAVEAWRAGAQSILAQTLDAEALAAALQATRAGLAVFDQAFVAHVFPAERASPTEALTQRERDVLQLMAEGLPNKSIATRLVISEHTVKFHVNAILSKLGVQSRTEAVVRAIRLGLITL